MTKLCLINADIAIKSYLKQSSLSEEIYQDLIAKPQQIARLIKIAIDPQIEGITNSQYPLIVCQILKSYPQLLITLFSVEGNAHCLFNFLQKFANPTQFGYFSKIVSLFTPTTQQLALKYVKQNNDIFSLLFRNIVNPSVFRFLFDCTILCKKDNQIRSIILTKLCKQIVLKPSEDIAKSIKDTFNQLTQNYSMLGATIKQTICHIFDEAYIKQILHLIKKNDDHFLSEYCVGILSRTILFYNKIKIEIEKGRQLNVPQNQISTVDTTLIQTGVIEILKSLKWLSQFLIMPDITIFKLRLSEFFKNIVLFYNDTYLLEFDFKVDDLLKNLIKQINAHPWANMIHNQLTDTALMLIQKHSKWDENIIFLLNDLMQLFKNRYYIFISSGKITALGNTNHFYLIIKKLSIELQKHQQFDNIFRTFKPWKKFLTDDIRKYEQNMKINTEIYPKTYTQLNESTISKIITRMEQRIKTNLMTRFMDDLDESLVASVNYSVWDKKKQSLK